MYDESTVFFAVGMSTDDYFVLAQLARRKGMTRSQLIMEALRQYLLAEQERWRREQGGQAEAGAAEAVSAPQAGGGG